MRQSDLGLAAAVILLLGMMVVPLPPAVLSLLISFNITVSLAVLLATLYTREPLQFSVFPSVLLLTTLFRLALNVSTTRLILLKGYAGEVVQRFGEFVVGGNPVVGFVVFLILVIVQFVVITRGAERVAEVAARFTLDAMPGKQMSIDADLNAGLIDEAEARRRRREIEREADFYGAMDGASKFVKGDAVASLIIVAINIVGGFLVGMLQLGLSWSESLHRFTLLTVGDGLVTQIPALLISTATGVLVTRAGSDDELSEQLLAQVLNRPRVLGIAAAALGILGLVPGLPKVPFFLLAAGFGAAAWVQRGRGAAPAADVPAAAERPDPLSPEAVAKLLPLDPVEVEIGYGLLSLAAPERGGDLMDRIGLIRRQLALELGFVLPLVRVRDNVQLPADQYVIRLRGVEVARGQVLADRLLALEPPGGLDPALTLPGVPGRDPAFGVPARWIAPVDRDRAEAAGCTVVEPAAVLATHLTQVLRAHAAELLGRQEVKGLLDALRETSPVVVEECVPQVLSLGEVQKVLQNLLRDGVSIRDLGSILEALADAGTRTKDVDLLTEAARQALGRSIARSLPVRDGRLRAIGLDPDLEAQLVQEGAADAAAWRRALESLRQHAQAFLERGEEPVVVCAPVARIRFKRLADRVVPGLRVVSFAELPDDIVIELTGVVRP
ncbi:MAG: flagellar biosynthesis protein FlhA [Clostridia bacterium]|nr:flagellar biosynthesis protein FlhA [Clostridia bacterium]